MDAKTTGGFNASGGTGGTYLATIAPTSAGMLLAAMHANKSEPGVPKPFAQPICLAPETRVAGTTHVDGIDEIAQGLAAGDRLRLERDPHNHYDRWAIRVYDKRGKRLGFICADINEMPARLMDAGKHLYGEVTEVELVGGWCRIGMGVWLDD